MNGLSAWHNFITESHHESWVMECQHVGRAERTQMPHQAVYETEPFYRKQATRCLAPLSGYQASLHPPWMCVRVCLSSWTTPCNMEVDTELNTELFAEQLDWYLIRLLMYSLHPTCQWQPQNKDNVTNKVEWFARLWAIWLQAFSEPNISCSHVSSPSFSPSALIGTREELLLTLGLLTKQGVRSRSPKKATKSLMARELFLSSGSWESPQIFEIDGLVAGLICGWRGCTDGLMEIWKLRKTLEYINNK